MKALGLLLIASAAPLALFVPAQEGVIVSLCVLSAALCVLSVSRPSYAVLPIPVLATCMIVYAAYLDDAPRAMWALTGDAVGTTSVLGLFTLVCAFATGTVFMSHLTAQRMRAVNLFFITWASAYLIANIAGLARFAQVLVGDRDIAPLFVGGVLAGAYAIARDEERFPRFVGGIAFILSAAMLVHAAIGIPGLSEMPRDLIPDLQESYLISTAVLVSDPRTALFGVGPSDYADAWQRFRSFASNGTVLWNQEPHLGASFFLTFLAEYGFVGLVTSIGVVAWILTRPALSAGAQITLIAVVSVLAFMPTGSLATGLLAFWAGLAARVPELAKSTSARYARISGAISISMAFVLIIAFVLVARMHAHAAADDAYLRLSPQGVDAFLAGISPEWLPFLSGYEARLSVWQSYARERIASGEPLVYAADSGGYDVLARLFSSVRDVDRIRSGARPRLLEAQLALESAERGVPAYLPVVQTHLDELLQEAPLHLVARALRLRVVAAQADFTTNAIDRWIIPRMQADALWHASDER